MNADNMVVVIILRHRCAQREATDWAGRPRARGPKPRRSRCRTRLTGARVPL